MTTQALARQARVVEIYKTERFSEYASIAIEYDFELCVKPWDAWSLRMKIIVASTRKRPVDLTINPIINETLVVQGTACSNGLSVTT